MIVELIHTSLARGLDGGSGYTVAGRTGGMPAAMSEALSRLSGLPPAWSDATLEEKILCAFRRVECAGQSLSVLSRIAPSGMDYTGRANRLSHHRVIDARVMSESDPAALLEDDALWRQEWVGAARELSGGILPVRLARDDAPLHTWEREFGDAGFAASVLDVIMKSGMGVWLVVPAMSKRLRLAAELMSLMPQKQRWQFTFATRPVAPGSESSVKICFVDEREPELAAHNSASAWIFRVGAGALAARPTGELAQRARHGRDHEHVNANQSAPKVRENIQWSPPTTLPATREQDVAGISQTSAKPRQSIDQTHTHTHTHGPVVIQVRRVAMASASSGVWKWFAVAFIVIAALLWFAVQSGGAS